MLVHDLSLVTSRSSTPFVRSCMEPLVGVLFSLGLADSFAAAAAAPLKQNLEIVTSLPLSNKRKATPEQEQERPTTKKPKTQTEAEAKVEREKKLEYQRKYRQAQAAKKRAAEREKVEAQRHREDEELEEGILAAFEEIE